MKIERPKKISDLLDEVRKHLKLGKYRYSKHANERLIERKITRPEVTQVLETGHSEKAKDAFDETFLTWNYAIRGKTVDGRQLRIVVSFEIPNLLIITAIDLDE
jgi:hypothetical protein